MVTYIRSDLDFILAQIKIAEAHANGTPLYGPGGQIPSYNLAWGLRTVDGTYNNLLPGRSEEGASDNPFPTLLGTDYRTIMVDPDGPGGMGPMPVSYQPGVDNDGPGPANPSDVFDPYVRTISNLIVDQTLGNPSAILTALQRAGVVDPSDEMTVLGTITAAYELIEAEFLAVSQTRVAYFNAATSAAANPSDPVLQQAAADALAALNLATAALDAVRGPLDALLEVNGIVMEGDNVQITNLAPDEGLSAPFNSWFTLFGQFFDHGLDLVAKGGAGTVFIPLMPDDPLYVPGGDTNFMVMTRATLGPDGPINTTTSFVDQNQTYASHASHQVFLRQYELNGAGDPVNTGHLIEGANGGMATWADMKAQASDMLGIWLRDQDVGNIPLLATDEYGNFIPGANGYPQVVFPGAAPGDPPVLVEGNPAANGGLGISVEFAIKTGHAFLADIAHSAVPDGIDDGDIEIGLGNGDGSATDGFYDNELLDAHFMAGDGRANENIGLVTVHHVFHSEHNRLVEHTKDVVFADAQAMVADGATQAEAVAFLNEWLVNDVSSVPANAAGLVWDGARLFQAARFGTEMQYQHLVFEEFARKIQPAINTFLVPDGYDVTIDPDIVAEFAHVVYRFGHSMLTETIDRYDPTMTADQISLIEGFLNPLEFTNGGGTSMVDADIAAGAIVRGMTRQAGNEIDEFVTSALRNNLLGLPLDLATINLARGRDTGVPSLNAARREFYDASNQNVLLKPYESWVDFASHLKNEASIINFIAAYGDHALITAESTIDGKRDAALTIITGVSVGGMIVPADRLDFLNATGAYAGGTLGGLEAIDLWIGGLAEETMPFGGMLGSTFNFVFEIQMEKLQSGDRFYYLQRLDGLHLFGEMEGNSFAAMISRNSDATHLPSDVFSTPGLILEVDQSRQYNLNSGVYLPGADGILGDNPLTTNADESLDDIDPDGIPGNGDELAGPDGVLGDNPLTTNADESLDDILNPNADPVGSGILTPLVNRNNPGTPGADTNYLRYTGGDHIVLGGTEANDVMIAGIGDDTLHGDGGADRMDGGFGNDIINGGAGNDIIVDLGGDDNIKAQDRHDVVHAGPGLDLVMGGAGQDFVVLGTDEGSEVFAGEGNDFILGNRNAERILGNEGNDWIETGTFDGAPGDNFDEIFAHDGIDGHDVFIGDGGFDEFIGEGGNDIMVGSPGRGKMAGMSGFDWATYKDNIAGVNADLSIPIIFDEAPTFPENAALDEYASMEGLSGSQHNDILRGTNDVAADRLPTIDGGTTGYRGSVLTAEGIAMIQGLQAMLRAGVTSVAGGDIILGGDGSDLIEGQGGDDIIDGDRWLDVRIAVHTNAGPNGGTGPVLEWADSMTELMARMFSGELNPGQLQIERRVVLADGTGDIDTALFSDVRSAYTITHNLDGTTTVAHTSVSPDIDNLESEGVDTLRNIERLQFGDGIILDIAQDSTGQPTINDTTPTEGQTLTSSIAGIADPDGLGAGPFSRQWQSSVDGLTWTNIPGATGVTFTPDDNAGLVFGDHADLQLRVVVSFTDGSGVTEVSVSNPTAPVGVDWDGTGGVNTLNGTRGDDVADAGGGNDILNGGEGDDDLDGDGGNDTITGGAGDDLINGDGNTDTAVFTGPLANYSFGLVGGNLTVTDNSGLDDVDTLISIETLRFGLQNLTLVQGTAAANGNINGNNSLTVADLVLGHGGADDIDAGTGNDVVDGGAGNDDIQWFANTATAASNANSDGRDVVSGGDGVDTFEVNGNTSNAVAETYRLYTRADAILAGITDVAAGTEIVITRGGANNASIIAELSNIEEIIIDTDNGNDTVIVSGNFDESSLDINTITVNGGTGDNTVDVSAMTSDHRLVFNSGGGNDVIIGQRAQDLFLTDDLITGSEAADVINAGLGNDDVLGLGSDDRLYGGLGADRTDGGMGNDWHFVENFADLVVEAAGQGTADRVFASASYGLTAGAEVELFSTSLHSGTAAINLTGNELANAIYGNEGANVLSGGGGNDSLNGWGGDDTLNGDEGADALDGGAGADVLNGGVGDDRLTGGLGVDTTHGGLGNDWHYVDNAGDMVVDGAGQGALDRVFVSASYALTAGAEIEIMSTTNHGGAGAIDLTGNALANLMYGNNGANVLNGAAGNDRIYANGGLDTLQWAAGGGRDFLDGGAGVDTVELTGDASAEVYRIYSRTEALAAGITGLNAATEIVITRNGTTAAAVVAELDNIEEIVITGMGGGDTFIPIGTFAGTSLMTSTITLNGSDGDDTMDISALTSAHRVVFRANGGDDTIVGTLRPDDVVEGLAAPQVLPALADKSAGQGPEVLPGPAGKDEAFGPQVLPDLEAFLVNAAAARFDFGGGRGDPGVYWKYQRAESWQEAMLDQTGLDGMFRRFDDDLTGLFHRDFDFL
jgi:Ca2+-binding RTX toxin-like protein